MAYTLDWAPSSRDDLKSIVTYIAEVDPWIAESFGLLIISKAEQLIEFPMSGRIVPEFGISNLRELIHDPYRIIYRITDSDRLVEVVRIWHAARGIPEL